MNFRITGLDPEPFQGFYGLSDDDLAAQRVLRVVADRRPGFPERVELRDAEPGETLLLVNYVHQPADNPYRASHAVFVREGARKPLTTAPARYPRSCVSDPCRCGRSMRRTC